MSQSTIKQLAQFGQSVWIDNINRSMLESGRLKEMIAIGLRGMTSNPTIFEKAISKSNDYDEKISELSKQQKSTFQIYDELTVRDVQEAADIFKMVYEGTNRLDGYVSLEINPLLADKVKETIDEGSRLWGKVNRPNLMLKVPATEAGFEAVPELIGSGMNVNVTLIFSQEQHVKTAQAYIKGLQNLANNKSDLSKLRSVASVFVSRIDTVTDKLLQEKIESQTDSDNKKQLQSLLGATAVANSKLIYNKFIEVFSSSEFKELQSKGASIQRPLWASTSTKNPAYNDTKYIVELIANQTVNTIPENTLGSFLDHGKAIEAIRPNDSKPKEVIDTLRKFDIDVDSICKKLLSDGLLAFEKSFSSLLASIENKTKQLCRQSN